MEAYVDGGCHGNGSASATMYGSFCIDGYSEYHNFGRGTNNQAEYLALIWLLDFLSQHEQFDTDITIYCDAQLVVNQIKGRWRCNDKTLQVLLADATQYFAQHTRWQLVWVPREKIVPHLGH